MITDQKSIGFPIMREEEGEKRAFLPDFINHLALWGFNVFLEYRYGNTLGYSGDDYKQQNGNIKFVDRHEVFQKDLILILRCPRDREFDQIGETSCLISMLHYPTRPARVKKLYRSNIQAISLDSLTDDFGVRLVENMKAVAWNGVEAAFNILDEQFPHLLRNKTQPWKVLVMGTGMVGKHAVDAATKFGKRSRNKKHMELGGEGVLAQAIGRNITNHPNTVQELLPDMDILIDATQRGDPSRPIIHNALLQYLPEHAVVVDLSVDPYLLKDKPKIVKGIEGIPQGNLDQYIFHPNDPNWGETIPAEIHSTQKRTTVTCYSWPGIHPEDCMRHYAQQLIPFMRVLAKKNYQAISPNGPFFERALYRAKLNTYSAASNLD